MYDSPSPHASSAHTTVSVTPRSLVATLAIAAVVPVALVVAAYPLTATVVVATNALTLWASRRSGDDGRVPTRRLAVLRHVPSTE
jgi:hypothetical protein